jgi:hypothetical protein
VPAVLRRVAVVAHAVRAGLEDEAGHAAHEGGRLLEVVRRGQDGLLGVILLELA